MGIPVTLYRFSKRENSTKQPSTDTAQFTVNCVLKAPCSVLSPVLELRLTLESNPAIYNYAYIQHFGRYYFISDWEWSNGLWIARLMVDPLASWRAEIGAANEYVLRSSSSYNGEITDNAYPLTDAIDQTIVEGVSPWALGDTLAVGDFVLAVQGTTTEYYVLSGIQLSYFLNGSTGLFSDAYADSVVGSWASVYPELKARLNPLQYISECRWFPFSFSGGELSSVADIPVGWGTVTAGANKIRGAAIQRGSLTFNIPRHPQAARGVYLNSSPFSVYSLFFPPFGVMPLDAALAKDAQSIRADWEVDARTGTGILKVWYVGETETLAGITAGKVGVDYAIGQILDSPPGAVTLAVDTATTLASSLGSDPVSGAMQVTGLATGLAGKIASGKVPMFSTNGLTGGQATLTGTPRLQCEFHRVVADDLQQLGRPLYQKRTLSSIPGYILVSNPDIAIPGTAQENANIKNFMSAGFYYE